jgi:hypothetical protein
MDSGDLGLSSFCSTVAGLAQCAKDIPKAEDETPATETKTMKRDRI